MGLFDKIKEPIFLKEESSLPEQLAFLEEMLKTVSANDAKKLEQEIRNLKSGIMGEKQVAFELKNSHIPMYVLHDLYLEYNGLTAQIDYLVLTRRKNFVIECKNLYGNMEITRQGDFIRNVNYQGKFFKERIYSPITQNERHLALIKQIRTAERKNVLTQALFEKTFSYNYRSIVVLANPKTMLNDRYAPKDIKNQVIPVDRLTAYIKKVNSEKDTEDCLEKQMTSLAHFFLDLNKPAPDYTKKYSQLLNTETAISENLTMPTQEASLPAEEPMPETEPKDAEQVVLCSRCGSDMVLRTATKGDNAGTSFYGCSRFPKCRNIVQLKFLL